MRPERGKDSIQIPITFDSRGSSRSNQSGKKMWLFLAILVWVVISVMIFVASASFWSAMTRVTLVFVLVVYVSRFLIFREIFFKSKRKELIENDYLFDHSVFWSVYEIDNRYPFTARFSNGMKAIFVAFDKGVIVGKESDDDYNHHESITEAYQQMAKKGIECIHIDYMDTAGKDDRMQILFAQAERIDNPDLKRVIMHMYDHILYRMNRTYASYDVYCFYSFAREDLFWDDLQSVIDRFINANYTRARALGHDDVAFLVESVMNISDFSVNRANDAKFREMSMITQYIRPIWVEVNGVRDVMNKTLEEIEEAKRVAQAEKKVRRKRSKANVPFKKKTMEPDIDLFTDSSLSIKDNSVRIKNVSADSQDEIDLFNDGNQDS